MDATAGFETIAMQHLHITGRLLIVNWPRKNYLLKMLKQLSAAEFYHRAAGIFLSLLPIY
jgi:hypothetical protein